MSFNGDDEITLEKNISGTWTVIDSIGQIGANGNINANQTLIRKSDIVQGDNIPNNAWTNSEWTVVSATSATNYGDLGKHTFNPE